MRNSIFSASVLLTIAACSSNDKKPAPSNDDTSSASESVQGMSQLLSAMQSGDAEAVADDALSLTLLSVAPASMTRTIALPTKWPTPRGESFTGSATCSSDSCTFVDYGDTGAGYSYTLNGTISYDGTVLAVDLTFDETYGGDEVTWALNGQITVTPSLIDGELKEHLTANDGSSSADMEIDVTYDHVDLDGSECPIDGSVTLDVSVTSTGQDAGSYSGTITADFGPSCGQVTVTASN